MSQTVPTIEDELRTAHRAQHLISGAEAEGRHLNAEEEIEVRNQMQKMRALDAKRRMRGEGFSDLLKDVKGTVLPPTGPGRAAAGDTVGAAFTTSAAYQTIQANLPTASPWRTPYVDAPFPRSLQAAALLSPTGGWGPAVAAPPPIPPPVPTVASLFAQGTASGGMVFYARDSGQAATAAVVAEGALKPELSLVLPQIEAQLATIALWAAVSNQTVEDVDAFRSWLDGVFTLDLLDQLDDEVVNGTGTGGRMLGVLPCPGVGAVAFTGPESAADAIARAIATAYAASRMRPDAIVIDPAAWTSLVTLKASGSGIYLSGAPLQAAPINSLWGIPVIASTVMPSGTALVGNFKRGGTLFTKGGVRLMASTEHSDYFTRNLTAVLGEIRAVLAIQRPPAFCKVTALPVPA